MDPRKAWNGTSMKDFNAEGASATRGSLPRGEDLCTCGHKEHAHVRDRGPEYPARCTICTCNGFDWDIDAAETRECENCGKQKPIEEMETVFARGHGETYQCIECRGGP